jgi:hypothetical protein
MKQILRHLLLFACLLGVTPPSVRAFAGGDKPKTAPKASVTLTEDDKFRSSRCSAGHLEV